MKIERYKTEFLTDIAGLFYDTIHAVCASDYSEIQLSAWASGSVDRISWDKSLSENYSLVAIESDKIVGFADVSATGFLDRLYVHKDFQRKGIATKLCEMLELHCKQNGISKLETHSSITARSFFNSRDFFIESKQTVTRNGIQLTNYLMTKSI